MITTTLHQLDVEAARLKGATPVLIMVGQVVQLREQLAQVAASCLSDVA